MLGKEDEAIRVLKPLAPVSVAKARLGVGVGAWGGAHVAFP